MGVFSRQGYMNHLAFVAVKRHVPATPLTRTAIGLNTPDKTSAHLNGVRTFDAFVIFHLLAYKDLIHVNLFLKPRGTFHSKMGDFAFQRGISI